MKKQLTLLLLIAAMLMSTVLTACSGGNDSTADTTVDTTTAETTTAAPDPIPEVKDYAGYEFRMLTPENRGNQKFDTDEMNGDTMNDIIYERNRAIEDDYNITITVFPEDPDIKTNVPKNVQAGDDFADITLLKFNQVFPIAQEGHLLDWYTVDGIMLDENWWDQLVYEQLDVGGKLYTIVGDFSTNDELVMFVVLYNKNMYKDYGFENAYDMVNSGKWTFDRFWEQVTSVSADLDGDGRMYITDKFGLITEYSAFTYFYSGAGYYSIDVKGGEFKLNLGDEKTFNIVEKMSVIATEKNKHSLIVDGGGVEGTYTTGRNMFTNNQGLFYTGALSNIAVMRDAEGDYGVLPIPKYEESQERYYNLTSWNTLSAQMPITVKDSTRAANILDAMGYYSREMVNDVFYNVFLDEKAIRDEESKGMLDILFATKGYNLDYVASITGFTTILGNIAKSGQNNFTSEYAKIENTVQAKIDDFKAAFND